VKTRNSHRLAALAIFIVCLLPGSAKSQVYQGICREARAAGFTDSYNRAKPHVGENTTDLSEVKVFVTVESNSLYLQSNHVSKGGGYPSKLATRRLEDLPKLIYEMLALEQDEAGNQFFDFSRATFAQKYKDINLILDDRLTSDTKFGGIKLGPTDHVNLVDSKGHSWPAKQLVDGKAEWVIEYYPSLFADPKADVDALYRLFYDQSFSKEDVRLLPLTVDSLTQRAIEERIPIQNRLKFDLSNADLLRKVLADSRDKLVMPLGHIENDSYVVRGAAGEQIFKIPLQELDAIGAEFNITFFHLGCNSARVTTKSGAASVFNTLDAVERLQQALDASKSYGQFFSELASSTLLLKVDDFQLLEAGRRRVLMTIYRENETLKVEKSPIGKVVINIPNILVARNQSSPSPSPDEADSNVGRFVCLGGILLLVIVAIIGKLQRRLV
jgi:hypothetical protein